MTTRTVRVEQSSLLLVPGVKLPGIEALIPPGNFKCEKKLANELSKCLGGAVRLFEIVRDVEDEVTRNRAVESLKNGKDQLSVVKDAIERMK